MEKREEFGRLAAELFADVQQGFIIWQLVVVVLALALAWQVSRLLRARISRTAPGGRTHRLRHGRTEPGSVSADGARRAGSMASTAKSPASLHAAFADSGVNLELLAWSENALRELSIQTALNLAIYRAFAANGIAMPYPQREVRIVGSVPSPPVESTRSTSN